MATGICLIPSVVSLVCEAWNSYLHVSSCNRYNPERAHLLCDRINNRKGILEEARLTGHDTSNEVRCRMLDACGGGEQETGSSVPRMSLGSKARPTV